MNPESTGPDVLMDVWTLILTPILSFAACLLGTFVAARSDNRRHLWRQREERFRILCWAVDLRASSDQQVRDVGEAALRALRNFRLVQKGDVDLVCWIANSLPTNDRSRRPYADQAVDTADPAVAADDSNLDTRGGDS